MFTFYLQKLFTDVKQRAKSTLPQSASPAFNCSSAFFSSTYEFINRTSIEALHRYATDPNAFRFTRLGFTESTLLFIYIVRVKLGLKLAQGEEMFREKIPWLYSTSGFYDKCIKGSYFNFKVDHITKSPVFRIFIDRMLEAVKGSTMACFRFGVKTKQSFASYFDSVARYLGLPNITACIDRNQAIDRLNGRKLLVVSSFAPLIADQIISGNAQRAYPGKKMNISGVIAYRTNYTFFNNKYGEESNFFVTLHKTCLEILSMDPSSYDVALISAGAYSSLIASCIAARHRKDTLTTGSDIQTNFAILNKRTNETYTKNYGAVPNEAFWITKIPEDYRPRDYQKIEGGCYW
jgi:hypothetical protein